MWCEREIDPQVVVVVEVGWSCLRRTSSFGRSSVERGRRRMKGLERRLVIVLVVRKVGRSN